MGSRNGGALASTGVMPRGQLSSLIQRQTHSCQRRQLRSGRLRPSPEPTRVRACGCRVTYTEPARVAVCQPALESNRLALGCALYAVLPRGEIQRRTKHVGPGMECSRTGVQFPPPPPSTKCHKTPVNPGFFVAKWHSYICNTHSGPVAQLDRASPS